ARRTPAEDGCSGADRRHAGRRSRAHRGPPHGLTTTTTTGFDVIVFGGGVGGCATALALARRGLTTVILERPAASVPRVGEHLAPDARPPLERLGVWTRFLADRHRPSPGVRIAW